VVSKSIFVLLITHLIIELEFITNLKIFGGITSGGRARAFQRNFWVISCLACVEISYFMQEFWGENKLGTSKPHKKSGLSVHKRNHEDTLSVESKRCCANLRLKWFLQFTLLNKTLYIDLFTMD